MWRILCNFAPKIGTNMKKYFLFALLALVMTGCGKNERLLTSATGSIYECLIVSNERVKDAVCGTMGADMYGLPQMEAIFTVTHVPASQFDDFFKSPMAWNNESGIC